MTAAAVEGMKPGSVVVDLAGETGGNCELTEPGQTVIRHDVTIASPLNLPATMPEHASELYSKNITALLDLLRSEEHTSELQSLRHLVCRLLLEKKDIYVVERVA